MEYDVHSKETTEEELVAIMNIRKKKSKKAKNV